MANENYNYIVATIYNGKRITLNASHIIGYMELDAKDSGERTIVIYTTGGFTFECYDEHEDYPYDSLSCAIDDYITQKLL